jgi:hypothetical protein
MPVYRNAITRAVGTPTKFGRARHPNKLLPTLVGAALLTLGLVGAGSNSALSQAVVQFVKVDVAVVNKGVRVSKITGRDVVNEKNEKVGSLDDVIIGRDKSLFGVVQVGGFLGLGSKLVAVPYDSLRIDDTGKRIELPGATKDELKNLAEYKYAPAQS